MKQLPVDLEQPQPLRSRPQLPRSCCCRPSTAAAFIAALYALSSLATGVLCTVMLAVKSVRDEVTVYLYDCIKQYNERLSEMEGSAVSYSAKFQEMTYDQFGDWVLLLTKVHLGLAVVIFLFCLMVFYGISTNKPCYLMPLYVWIFSNVILSVVTCFYSVDTYPMWSLLAVVTILGIKMYFLVCIWNAYKQLKFQAYQDQGYDTVHQVDLPNYEQAMMGKEPPPPAYSP